MLDNSSGGLSAKDAPSEQHRYRLQYVPNQTDPDSISGDALWVAEYNNYAPYENWEVRYTDSVLDARYFARPVVDVMMLREGIYPRGNIRVYETMPGGSTEILESSGQ